MKDILGLGISNIDILYKVSDDYIESNGLVKGCWNRGKHKKDLQMPKDGLVVPGGSPGNTITNSAFLGCDNGFIGTVGSDDYGRIYRKDLMMNRVEDHTTQLEGKTNVLHMFITPDKERTSISEGGVSGNISVPLDVIDDYKIFHTSMYEVITDNKEVMKALTRAYRKDKTISFDLSDPLVVKKHKELAKDIVNHSNIVFANEREAEALTGLGPEYSAESLSRMCDLAVVKMGKKGSIVMTGEGLTYRIPCFPANVVDTTGAGDAYSAGFLYGWLNDRDIDLCGGLGSFVAARVCERYGGRLRNF